MATIKHPTIGNVHDVPDADLAEWVAAGWLDTTPRPKKVADKIPSRDDVR